MSQITNQKITSLSLTTTATYWKNFRNQRVHGHNPRYCIKQIIILKFLCDLYTPSFHVNRLSSSPVLMLPVNPPVKKLSRFLSRVTKCQDPSIYCSGWSVVSVCSSITFNATNNMETGRSSFRIREPKHLKTSVLLGSLRIRDVSFAYSKKIE